MIQAVIFDCFGVLTGDLWKEFVASLSESQRPSAQNLNRALDAGFISHSEFYQQIHELTGRQPKEVEGIITSKMQKNVPLLDLIGQLSTQYKIGLLSNISSDWITTDFLSNSEASLFDEIVPSYQIGVTKPDIGAYKIVASKLGVEPGECLFIDDSQTNCFGAEDAGMKAILYTDFATLKNDLKSMLQ
jgi:HAD superfamily hydrolase (TIGR01509 family)